jgi:hypothetical protein
MMTRRLMNGGRGADKRQEGQQIRKNETLAIFVYQHLAIK